jgi:RNA polymerase sigma-70 factor (ECF subfamily)
VTMRLPWAGVSRERSGAEPSDEELMARCRTGDGPAMDLLVARYYQRLFGFAYRMLRDREASEDVAQETLVRAYRNAACFRAEGQFSTWLLAIAANLCRTELRQRSRRPDRPEEPFAEPEAPGSVEADALRRLEGHEVYRALNLLSPEHRLVVVLFYFEEMSQPEIARVCGCAVGTVKSRLHYALARLRSALWSPAGASEEV